MMKLPLPESFVTSTVCVPLTLLGQVLEFKFIRVIVKFYDIKYSHKGLGEEELSPLTHVAYHTVIHDSSHFPQRSKFSKDSHLGFR